jgi:transglutaminase-like putative cysteine protease
VEQSRIKTFAYYLFAFWLLWEWLAPLTVVSDTKNIQVFIVFVAFYFLLELLRVPLWLSVCLKIGYLFYALNDLFFHAPFLSFQWLFMFGEEAVYHLSLIRHFQWEDMTDRFRTFLFFLMLWMMCYLVQYWLVKQKRIWLFLVMTFIYVAVLDTFTPFSGTGAIVRLVGAGFFLLSWLHYERLPAAKQPAKWLVMGVVAVGAALLCGYAGPKLAPQWPDPVAFIKSYAAEDREQDPNQFAVKKIGYGNNDSRLGGPFIADNTVVFTAEDEETHYWRVETKDIYTGKGWDISDSVQVKTFEQENNVHQWFENSVEKKQLAAHVRMVQPASYLVYPEGLKTIHVSKDIVFRMEAANEKIYPTDRESYLVPLQEYELTYEYPTFSIEKLKASPPVTDEQILKRYTQLPDHLPKRVQELAQQITKQAATTYEKVKAIEQYFHLNGFAYETKDVAVPSRNQDYVDQFLFETKKGYCDNFSTAMIVLLRSIDIPARWVKGYTSGQWVDETDDGKDLYRVTNNNAHSWVEVYFSGIGWVPFEPTQGFNNPYEFTEAESAVESTPVPEQQQTQTAPNRTRLEEQLQQDRLSSSPQQNQERLLSIVNWKSVLSLTVSLMVLTILLYGTRRKWWPYITLLQFKYRHGGDTFVKAYNALLRHLKSCGLKRKEGQTLRQYAAYIDNWFGTNEMSQLTQLYERVIYKNEIVDQQWEEVKELWENLIKRIAS